MATSFDALHLRPELVAACRKQGFRAATPIQALVIPHALRSANLIVESKTGSGKTLAYGLPLLNGEPSQTHLPEALVVVPTRELASQVEAEINKAARATSHRIVAVTGGGGMDRQAALLKAGASIVVGTLGRIEELISRQYLDLSLVRTLVLDEADELIVGGFAEKLLAIVAALPNRKQTLVFSASISHDVENISRKFMGQAKRLQLTAGRDVPEAIDHRIIRTDVASRLDDLTAFLEIERPFQTLLFCSTRKEAEEVCDELGQRGVECKFLHGDLSAVKRRNLIDRFRKGEPPVLVATDIAARGLDLPGVDVVVNYSLPEAATAYMHRAGRTGRAGKPGLVVTMLILQQHQRFENLKQSIPFEKIDLRKNHLVVRQIKTREERDLQYRKLPRKPFGQSPNDEQPDRAKESANPPKPSQKLRAAEARRRR